MEWMDGGDYVKFEDHEKIVKELTSKIAKLEKHIELLEYSVARGE
jgi:chaperonin cofactor prefoldin